MKASELVHQLELLIDAHGDFKCYTVSTGLEVYKVYKTDVEDIFIIE